MGCNVKLLFWRQICCHCSSPNFVLHVTSHVYAHPSGGFWKKEEYYTSLLHLKMYVCVCLPPFFHTLMSLARLSRELISRPSLQACKQEITFWVSMRPGRIVRPERLPWKYWVNLGVATSPPDWRGQKTREPQGRKEKWDVGQKEGPVSQCQPIPSLTFSLSAFFPCHLLSS